MKKVRAEKNWVSEKMLKIMTGVLVLLVLVSTIFHKVTVLALVCSILSLLMLLIIMYFLYVRYKLTLQGGDLQNRISSLVINKINKNSTQKLLDIGCGCGILSIELAIKCPKLKIWGIDYWGGVWCYSKKECERLAEEYNVSDRVIFEKASASSLPFENESFDIIISNMVFHEVADAKDKREVIKEAFRVLKKGGQFVFQDLFLSKNIYGSQENLIQYIKNLDVEKIDFEKTEELISIPTSLRSPMFFGNTALLSGYK